MENIFFTQKSFYLQGILNKINEQESFLDCKHKHMMKSGAPPDSLSLEGPLLTFNVPRLKLDKGNLGYLEQGWEDFLLSIPQNCETLYIYDNKFGLFECFIELSLYTSISFARLGF